MGQVPTRSTRTDILFPSTTRVRSPAAAAAAIDGRVAAFAASDGILRREPKDRQQQGQAPSRLAYGLPRFPRGAASAGAVKWMRLVIQGRSEEHTSELQSLMRNSYAVFHMKKKKKSESKHSSR